MELVNSIERKWLYYSGETNTVYLTNNPKYLEMELLAENGVMSNISKAIFTMLEEYGIPTHYIGSGSNQASKIVKKVSPILLEVIGKFNVTGSYVEKNNVTNMMQFDEVYVEYTYKSDATENPPICEADIIANGILTKRELGYVEYVTERVAYVIKNLFEQCNGNLIDFKIEFGKLPNGQIIVIDEILPDTCHIFDKETGKSIDMDKFCTDMFTVLNAYL